MEPQDHGPLALDVGGNVPICRELFQGIVLVRRAIREAFGFVAFCPEVPKALCRIGSSGSLGLGMLAR